MESRTNVLIHPCFSIQSMSGSEDNLAVLNSTLSENEALLKQQTPAQLDQSIMSLDPAQHSLGVVYLL